jgi:hypothetical protein
VTAPQLVKRHAAGVAHFAGDSRAMVGEVKGPATYGGYVVATAAVYDADRNRTTVAFGHCLPTDLQRAVLDDDGRTVRLPGVTVSEQPAGAR